MDMSPISFESFLHSLVNYCIVANLTETLSETTK